jgi:hypothetical protein
MSSDEETLLRDSGRIEAAAADDTPGIRPTLSTASCTVLTARSGPE